MGGYRFGDTEKITAASDYAEEKKYDDYQEEFRGEE
jgi:hypothetical protein